MQTKWPILSLMSTVNFHFETFAVGWYIAPKIPVLNRIKFSRKFRTTSSGVSTVYVESDDPFVSSLWNKGLSCVIKSYQRNTV